MASIVETVLSTKGLEEKFQYAIKNSFDIAMEAFLRFRKENEAFFSFPQGNILGHLLTYSINKQLSDDSYYPNSVYSTQSKAINTFNYKGLMLYSGDYAVSVGRTAKSGFLLPVAKYKKELALANEGMDGQLQFVLDDKDSLQVEKPFKYAQITYGVTKEKDVLTHLSILIPNSAYTGTALDPIDLLSLQMPQIALVPEKEKEEQIVHLKNALVSKAKII